MTTAFLAPSLVRFRAEIDARWPNRDRRSDGWIGDAAHQATPSDHNPDYRGMVHAIDVDIDGITKATVLDAAIGDSRVYYVIHDGKIWSRTYGWVARPYTGASPHEAHIHISCLHTYAAEQSTLGWLPAPGVHAARPVVDLSRLRRAARTNPWCYRAGTAEVQHALRVEGLLGPVFVRGRFGTGTRRAFAAWQRRLGYSGHDANGVPGLTSLTKLGKRRGFSVVG